jgi:hypothetical protein
MLCEGSLCFSRFFIIIINHYNTLRRSGTIHKRYWSQPEADHPGLPTCLEAGREEQHCNLHKEEWVQRILASGAAGAPMDPFGCRIWMETTEASYTDEE